MSDQAPHGTSDQADEDRAQSSAPGRIATVPNALCLIRFFGSFVLAGLALTDAAIAFVWLFLILSLTDLLDGKIAVWFDQRSALGPRLDSWADATMYAALAFGAYWLHEDQLQGEYGWILAAILSYALSTLAALIKFGRWPSYHTRTAKISWGLVLVGVVCLFVEWSIWPLRIALAGVTIANIEAILLTLRLSEWRSDVESLLDIDRDTAEHPRHREHAPDENGERRERQSR